MAAREAFQFDPAVIDELANRLSDVLVQSVLDAIRAEGLIPGASRPEPWLDANEVAEGLRMSRDWVYAHAEELGASRMGDGPRPRLRFPPSVVEARSAKPPSSRDKGSSQPRIPTSGLIPIRGS